MLIESFAIHWIGKTFYGKRHSPSILLGMNYGYSYLWRWMPALTATLSPDEHDYAPVYDLDVEQDQVDRKVPFLFFDYFLKAFTAILVTEKHK